MSSLKRPMLVCFLLLILFSLYWYGADQQLRLVNTNMNWADQGVYMDYARKLVESDYTYTGTGNQTPLYPFLQSLIYDTELSDDEFFTRGKYVNLALSIVFLTSIFLIIRSRLKWHLALNFMLISVFTVFIFKAPYFQAEVQFYFFSLVFFVLMLRLFSQPSYLLAAITGVVVGLAYLTKASVTPGLLLFLFFISLKSLFQLVQRRRSMPIKQAFIAGRPLLLAGPLVAIFFLITVYTQIRNNHEIFGSYFYNVNSTFYMWYDSWREVEQGTRAHGDGVGWPEMPPDEIPSLRKYLREHTPAQILERLWSGTQLIVKSMYHSYGYLKYVVFYLLLLLLVASWQWWQTKQLFRTSPFMILFALTYFSAYFLLYSWYVPINPGPRFMMALILPILFILSRSLQAYHFPRSQIIPRRLDFLAAVSLLLLAALTLDIYLIMTQRIATNFGGW